MTDFEKGMQIGMRVMAGFSDSIIDILLINHRHSDAPADTGAVTLSDKARDAIRGHHELLKKQLDEPLTPV